MPSPPITRPQTPEEDLLPDKTKHLIDGMEHIFFTQTTKYGCFLTCFDYEQRFNCYMIKDIKGGTKYEKVFRAAKQSSILHDYCFCADSKEIALKLCFKSPNKTGVSKDGKRHKNNWEPFIRLYKSDSCFLQYIGRQIIGIEYITSSTETRHFGYIVNCSDKKQFKYQIFKRNDSSVQYTVVADRFQVGFLCKYTCGFCDKVMFSILDRYDKYCGDILKVWPGCTGSNDKPGSLAMRLPLKASWDEKIILIALGLYVTTRFFEEKQSKPCKLLSCCD